MKSEFRRANRGIPPLTLIGVAPFRRALKDPLGLLKATVALSEDALTILPSVDTFDRGAPAYFQGRTPMSCFARSSKNTRTISPWAYRWSLCWGTSCFSISEPRGVCCAGDFLNFLRGGSDNKPPFFLEYIGDFDRFDDIYIDQYFITNDKCVKNRKN
ncbi:hypothetical protein ATCV1_z264R [Acanthocystis turfacea chlorella virus 1]|uniref:Uncharacterized protein z264R n=1 Tax=Chlorovirus heliozoae TaxID=322019 RepID=A7K8M4_9PHYC|nr:hypothetical protein ATCV1_z264R [Acanthocystis turfacea chlorella virus 1]ABT16398.1 hypothetical protein ATCV1_z264R [Acanthocystis turfacea chlorella virus 1]